MADQAKTTAGGIAQALAAAQAEMGKALKQAANPHFKSKYADLGAVMDACLPALNKHGIAVIQPLSENEYGRFVVTKLLHASGETLECPVPLIIGKQDMQGLGSAITYARRYGLMALAGIAPEDDDGNAAAASVRANPPKRSWAQTITDELPEDATADERAEAVEKALLAQWKRKKTPGELNNEWDRRMADHCLEQLEKRFPERFERVRDAWQARMDSFQDAQRETAGIPT